MITGPYFLGKKPICIYIHTITPIGMPTSNLIALDAAHIIEMPETNTARPLSEDPLYIHSVDGGVQVLNDDTTDSNNKRDFSYYADVGGSTDNYRLSLTPFSYTDIATDKHDSSKFRVDYGDGPTDPSMLMEYKILKLYVSNGFSWPADVIGEALEVFIEYGARKIRLMNFYDAAAASQYMPAGASLSYNNKVYVSCVGFRIMDIEALLENDAPEAEALRRIMFGVGDGADIDRSIISSYKFRYKNVLAADYETISESGANTGGVSYMFERFRAYDWNNAYKLRAGYSKGLRNVLKITPAGVLAIGLSHDTHAVAAALSRIGNIGNILVRHSLSIQEFDGKSDRIGDRKIVLENPSLQYGEILFRPIITDAAEAIVAQLRTIITFIDTDVEVNKYTTVNFLQDDVSRMRDTVSLDGLVIERTDIVNKIEKSNVRLSLGGGKKFNATISQKLDFIDLREIEVDGELRPAKPLAIALGKTKRAVVFKFYNNGEMVDLSPFGQLYIGIGGETTKESARPSANGVLFYLRRASEKNDRFEMVNERGVVLISGGVADQDAIESLNAKKAELDARHAANQSAKQEAGSSIALIGRLKELAVAQGDARKLTLDDKTLAAISKAAGA